MSIRDLIQKHVGRHFNNTKVFAEELIIYPDGDLESPQSTKGVWDEDAITGSNETIGDGRMMNRQGGRDDRKSVTIELPVNAPVSDSQGRVRQSIVEQVTTGKRATVKRITGRDEAMISVLAIMNERVSKRRGSTTG